MACSSREQLYWKRVGQYELLQHLIVVLEKQDKNTVLEKLRKIYVEIEMELSDLAARRDPLLAELVGVR